MEGVLLRVIPQEKGLPGVTIRVAILGPLRRGIPIMFPILEVRILGIMIPKRLPRTATATAIMAIPQRVVVLVVARGVMIVVQGAGSLLLVRRIILQYLQGTMLQALLDRKQVLRGVGAMIAAAELGRAVLEKRTLLLLIPILRVVRGLQVQAIIAVMGPITLLIAVVLVLAVVQAIALQGMTHIQTILVGGILPLALIMEGVILVAPTVLEVIAQEAIPAGAILGDLLILEVLQEVTLVALAEATLGVTLHLQDMFS